MKDYTSQPCPYDLNENEFKVLEACAANIDHNTRGDFGYSDEIVVEGLNKHQISGYLSQLSQKKYIMIYDSYNQIQLKEKGVLLFDLYDFCSNSGWCRTKLLEFLSASEQPWFVKNDPWFENFHNQGARVIK